MAIYMDYKEDKIIRDLNKVKSLDFITCMSVLIGFALGVIVTLLLSME